MKLKSMQCPNCGGQLEEKDSRRLKCSSCLSEFEKEPASASDSSKAGTGEKKRPRQIFVSIHQEQKSRERRKRNRKFVFVLLFFMLLSNVIFLVIGTDHFKTLFTEAFDLYTGNSASSAGAGGQLRAKPESEAMVSFAEQVFLKPIDEITAEDMSSIRYLEVSMNDGSDLDYQEYRVFRYGFELYAEYASNYPAQEIMISRELEIEIEDFSSYAGLEYLDYSTAYDIGSYASAIKAFAGLEHLNYFGANRKLDLKDYDSFIEDKDSITGLSCRIEENEDLERLAGYTNLKKLSAGHADDGADLQQIKKLTQLNSLTLDLSENQDISFLSGLTNLKELTLICTDKTSDFSALSQLTNLEKLTLTDASSLKSIDFVKNLPNLKSFSLDSSKVKDLEALRGKQTLTKVELTGNYDLKDITALDSLTDLKELTCDYALKDTKWSSLSGHRHLAQAHISHNLIEMLAGIAPLKKMTIESNDEPAVLDSRFSQLEELALHQVNSSSKQDFLDLTSLKVLHVYDSGFYEQKGRISFFRLPQLEELLLQNTGFILDPAYIEGSDNLKKLTLRNVSANIYREDQDQSFKEGLAPFQDSFSAFPNLEEFTAVSGELNSLTFLANMQNLVKVDVSDNYITDLSPLSGLENLKIAGVADNPAGNKDAVSDRVVYLP